MQQNTERETWTWRYTNYTFYREKEQKLKREREWKKLEQCEQGEEEDDDEEHKAYKWAGFSIMPIFYQWWIFFERITVM